MKKKLKLYSFLMILSLLILNSCGPSSESSRDNKIQDSLEMEQERQELLNRANKILENDTTQTQENSVQQDSTN